MRALLVALLCCASWASAQTLARKGWAGSGISVEPWYQSAIFYQVDPLTFQDSNGDGFGDLLGILARLPYLEQLGVDALVLSPLPLNPPSRNGASPFDSTYGAADDFDRLEREANAHHVRLLVDLACDVPREQLAATARFWLSRGVAGLRLTGCSAEAMHEVRAIAGPGRILVSSGAQEPAVASRHPLPRVLPDRLFDRHLTIEQTLTPTLLREALAGANLSSDAANIPRSLARLGDGAQDIAIARIAAAALLLGRGAPLLYFGQELGMAGLGDPTPMQWGAATPFSSVVPWIPMGPNAGTANVTFEQTAPDSLLNWYRKLAQLHHAEAAVHTGTLELLPTPNASLVAWLRKPRTGSAPAVLVVVNLSTHAIVTPLSSLLSGRTATLTLLAKTAIESEPLTPVTAIPLEPFGVYIAELRSAAGLENSVLPPRLRRRR